MRAPVLAPEGDLIVPVEELQEILKLKSGEIFRGTHLAHDINGLTTFYGNRGYAFANADPAFALDRQALTVGIKFKMEKGPEVHIRDIDIVLIIARYTCRDSLAGVLLPFLTERMSFLFSASVEVLARDLVPSVPI